MKPVGIVPILVPARNLSLSFFTNESIATLWPDGVPHDGTPREVTHYSLIPLTAVCYVYATVGIFFAIACLLFNVVFRNKK
jgi:gamma-aminobutyric acid type B receptor